MNSKYRDYLPLKDGEENLENPFHTNHSAKSWLSRRGGSIIVLATLLLSLILNAVLVFQRINHSEEITVAGHTAYAHLANDFAMEWTSKSPYYGEDKTKADLLWERISIDNGSIALGDSYVETMGLPASQRFPWDQQKGIYLLNGFHSMHCLKTIRQAVLEFDRGLNRSEPVEHIFHCLDALRQDVLCYADDTPRYTGFQPNGRSGTGQFR